MVGWASQAGGGVGVLSGGVGITGGGGVGVIKHS